MQTYLHLNLQTERPVQTGSNWSFIGPCNFQIEMDWRLECGCGLKWSTYFPVHFSPGPVQSRSFGGPRTELPNTTYKISASSHKFISPFGRHIAEFHSHGISFLLFWLEIKISRLPLVSLFHWSRVVASCFPLSLCYLAF